MLFTSCATESNNTAIFGTAKANPNRRHIITTAVEHPAVLGVCKDLQRNGYDVTFLGVDGKGNLDVDEFVLALQPDTLLVTIMHANNETGVVFPVEQLRGLPRKPTRRLFFTPMPRNRWARCPSICSVISRTWICFPSRDTRSMPRRVLGACMSSAGRLAGPS